MIISVCCNWIRLIWMCAHVLPTGKSKSSSGRMSLFKKPPDRSMQFTQVNSQMYMFSKWDEVRFLGLLLSCFSFFQNSESVKICVFMHDINNLSKYIQHCYLTIFLYSMVKYLMLICALSQTAASYPWYSVIPYVYRYTIHHHYHCHYYHHNQPPDDVTYQLERPKSV